MAAGSVKEESSGYYVPEPSAADETDRQAPSKPKTL